MLRDKNEYVIHIKNLKQALNHGLILKEVHKAISFNQDKWLKQYIEVNTELRQKVKNDFEKDFIKLMNNVAFGKTMDNVNMEIYNLSQLKEQETIWCQNQSTIQQSFSQSISYQLKWKTQIIMNKPIYLGLAILDISKIAMYDFWYNYIKLKYREKAKLYYMDVDKVITHM